MKSLSLILLSLIATQAYANLLEGLEHAHGHGDHGHDHAHDHHGEHGDHGHGEHGDHGHEHADHGEHGDHGENAEHGEHGDHGEHGEHGDHGHADHGAHGDHAEGHHDHAEGDHQHDTQNTVNNDAFANTLASDLGGGFLSSNPVPSNDFGAHPSNDLSQGFLQANPVPTQAPVQAPRQNTQAASSSSINQGKQLLDGGELGGPKYNTVPQTSFRCEDQATGGYFADTEADCQVFHICLNGDNLGSFLCPNGTLFHQQYFVCDWWFNVDCNVAPDSYNLNAAIGVVPEENK